MKRKITESSHRLLALDLDGTLTRLGNKYEQYLKRYFLEQDKFEKFITRGSFNIDRVVSELLNDTETALFGRIIKACLKRGDKVAITTFNMVPKYCEFVLVMMGLNMIEIAEVAIRCRVSGEKRDEKLRIKQILEMSDYLFGGKIAPHEIDLTLVDDNINNCNAAKAKGYNSIYVNNYAKGLPHLNELALQLDLDSADLDSVQLTNKAIRVDTAIVVTRERQYAIEFAENKSRVRFSESCKASTPMSLIIDPDIEKAALSGLLSLKLPKKMELGSSVINQNIMSL